MIKKNLHKLKQWYIDTCLDELITVARYEMTFKTANGEEVTFITDKFDRVIDIPFDKFIVTCRSSIEIENQTYYTKYIIKSSSKIIESYVVRYDDSGFKYKRYWTREEIDENRFKNKNFLDKYEELYKTKERTQ